MRTERNLLIVLVPVTAFAPGPSFRPHAARLYVATRLNDGVVAATTPIDMAGWFKEFNEFVDELDDDELFDTLSDALNVIDAQPPASTVRSSPSGIASQGKLRATSTRDEEAGQKSVVRLPMEVERCEVGPWVGLRPKNP